jgi:SAM-dependent methyltransferase
MTKFPGTDRDTLTQQVYATEATLTVRQRTHEMYSVPKVNFAEWVLDRIPWRGDERVLDIGAGPGTYFEALAPRISRGQLVAGDLSLGMIRRAAKHPQAGHLLNADVQRLPFPAETFDVVLANHMLYHVPDLDLGIEEIQRVLKPTGCLIAATNSQYNMPEFEQLIRRSYHLLGAVDADSEVMRPTAYHFQLEDGAAKLARQFYAVARYDLPGAFIFPSAQPAIDYINSTRPLREPQLPVNISWDDFITVMHEQIQRLINHFGELVVNKLSGVLVGTNAGAFAKDFISIQNSQEQLW